MRQEETEQTGEQARFRIAARSWLLPLWRIILDLQEEEPGDDGESATYSTVRFDYSGRLHPEGWMKLPRKKQNARPAFDTSCLKDAETGPHAGA